MQSRWSDSDAARLVAEATGAGQPASLGLRVYTSRLIGQDPDLVLHGGGNTSLKIFDAQDGPVIHVKGSGWDLGDIAAPGLPAMRLAPLLGARDIAAMSDPDMVAFLRANLLDQSAPTPSVEALLHAFLPHAFVDHCHSTAILALADQAGPMRQTVDKMFAGKLGYVPYVMPGFDLSHACDRVYRENPAVEGLWLEKHGLFTFGETARESYERMIAFVTIAENALAASAALPPGPEQNDRPEPSPLTGALHKAIAGGALGHDPSLDFRSTPSIRRYLDRPNLAELSARGTATPDHVIRIKPSPLLVSADADAKELQAALWAFAAKYEDYFQRNAALASEPKTMLDVLPRAVLVPGVGLFGLGRSDKDARIAADLWEQTARIVNAAEDWGSFEPLGERDLFEMEYWSLEQAKLAGAKG